MAADDVAVHLFEMGDRENRAVDELLPMLAVVRPEWYTSLGINETYHWAVIRAELKTSNMQDGEVDVIMGNTPCLQISGAPRPIWPPPTDYLVAVEAKCIKKKSATVEPWEYPVARKHDLPKQLERDIKKLGFSRVLALHVFTMPSTHSFGNAMETADTIASRFLMEAEREVRSAIDESLVGHGVLGIGEVSYRSYSQSGAVHVSKMKQAPYLGEPGPALQSQVNSILRELPNPLYWPALFRQVNGRAKCWGQL
jgi:hypothetical protein